MVPAGGTSLAVILDDYCWKGMGHHYRNTVTTITQR